MDRSRLEESFAAYETKLGVDAVMDEPIASAPPVEQEPSGRERLDQQFNAYEEKLQQQKLSDLSKTRKQVQYSMEKNPDQMVQVHNTPIPKHC